MSASKRNVSATRSSPMSARNATHGALHNISNYSNKENPAMRPQQLSKSLLIEPKVASTLQMRTPFSTINQMERVSESSLEDSYRRQSSIVSRRSSVGAVPTEYTPQHNYFMIIIAILVVFGAVGALLVKQSQSEGGIRQQAGVEQTHQNSQFDKTMVIADIIAKSIKKDLWLNEMSVGIEAQRQELAKFYVEEFSNELWYKIQTLVDSDDKIHRIYMDGVQYWSI